jgi:TRAP-type C4-dicarboxylate transport system permease small subunit
MSRPQAQRTPSQEALWIRIINRLSELSGYVSGVLILVSMLVICYAVILRYVLGASTIWQTELSIYLLMFAAFVGGAYGLKHGDHVSIDLLVNRLPGKVRLYAKLLAAILGFVFVVIISVIAFILWWETTAAGRHSGTAWNPPLTYPYFIVPLGMTLISLQYLVIVAEIVQQLFSGRSDEPTPDESENVVEGGQQQ